MSSISSSISSKYLDKSLDLKYDDLNIQNLNFQYLSMYNLMLILIYYTDDVFSLTYLLELLDSS